MKSLKNNDLLDFEVKPKAGFQSIIVRAFDELDLKTFKMIFYDTTANKLNLTEETKYWLTIAARDYIILKGDTEKLKSSDKLAAYA